MSPSTPERVLLAHIIAADSTAAAGVTPAHESHARQQLEDALTRLKPKLLQTWLYVHKAGLSITKTAEMLGYKTDKTIKRHLQEALEDLATDLGIVLPPRPDPETEYCAPPRETEEYKKKAFRQAWLAYVKTYPIDEQAAVTAGRRNDIDMRRLDGWMPRQLQEQMRGYAEGSATFAEADSTRPQEYKIAKDGPFVSEQLEPEVADALARGDRITKNPSNPSFDYENQRAAKAATRWLSADDSERVEIFAETAAAEHRRADNADVALALKANRKRLTETELSPPSEAWKKLLAETGYNYEAALRLWHQGQANKQRDKRAATLEVQLAGNDLIAEKAANAQTIIGGSHRRTDMSGEDAAFLKSQLQLSLAELTGRQQAAATRIGSADAGRINATEEMEERQYLSELDNARAESRLVEGEIIIVGRALERLANGDYGRCQVCAGPIAITRLTLQPAAELCSEACLAECSRESHLRIEHAKRGKAARPATAREQEDVRRLARAAMSEENAEAWAKLIDSK